MLYVVNAAVVGAILSLGIIAGSAGSGAGARVGQLQWPG
jgi:hypothetical protein